MNPTTPKIGPTIPQTRIARDPLAQRPCDHCGTYHADPRDAAECAALARRAGMET